MADGDRAYIVDIVAPLFNFTSDSSYLQLNNATEIVKYSRDALESYSDVGDFSDELDWLPPDYVVRIHEVLGPNFYNVKNGKIMLAFPKELIVDRCERLLTSLRLFRPGRLQSGKTYIMWHTEMPEVRSSKGKPVYCVVEARIVGRQPFPYDRNSAEKYELNSSDLGAFQRFADRLAACPERLARKERFRLALDYYQSSYEDKRPETQIVDLFVALESLLLDDQSELTFKLAMRAANAIGRDGADRIAISDTVRKYYALRSRIVHGAELRERDRALLDKPGDLRQVVRRTVLSLLAVESDEVWKDNILLYLDNCSLDEDLRIDLQKAAAGLLDLAG